MKHSFATIFTAAAMLLPAAGIAQNPTFSPPMPSQETEIDMGRRTSLELEQSVKLLNDPAVVEYVNRIAQNIVRNSDAQVPFTIRVIDSDEVNVIALPGGFFYINSGLLLVADNEQEFAGVLAHGIAHVAARHAAQQRASGALTEVLAVPAPPSSPANLIQQSAAIRVPVTFVVFGRQAEEESDVLALEYASKAGYDPLAIESFFARLQNPQRAAGTVSPLFSTHPLTDDRLNKSRTAAASLPTRPQTVVTSEFQDIKARVMALAR